jgi:uncharacterized FlgJ-related protein
MLSSLFGGVYGGVIKISLVLALLGALYGGYRYKVNQEVKAAVAVERVEQQKKLEAEKEVLLLKKRSAEKSLNEDFKKRQGESDAKIKSLNATVNSLLAGVQSRPAREVSTTNSARDTSTGQSTAGATGAGLFKPDAEFLIRYSANTETLKLGLLQCYKDYESVKKSLESYSNK